MMAADSLHVAVHLIVPSGVPIRWLSACRRVCSASASALHFALPSHCLLYPSDAADDLQCVDTRGLGVI